MKFISKNNTKILLIFALFFLAPIISYAYDTGNLEIVKCFAEEQKAKVNAKSDEGKTALYFAKYHNNTEIIIALEAVGAK